MMDDETREIIRRLTDITEARDKRIDELKTELIKSEEVCRCLAETLISANAEAKRLREALTSVQERRIDAAVEGSDWKSRAMKAEADRDAALSRLGPCYHSLIEDDCPSCQHHKPFMEVIGKLQAENAKLRDDAARWNYIRLACSQIGSAIMSGQHYWRFRQPYGLQGPTIDEAMDNAMRERPKLSAAKDKQ